MARRPLLLLTCLLLGAASLVEVAAQEGGRTPLPRIFFDGTIEVDAATGNNQNNNNLIDPSRAILRPVDRRRFPTDDDLRHWMSSVIPVHDLQQIRAGWNYHGVGTFSLESRVVGVQWADGSLHTDPAADPVIGLPVHADQGRVADVDPRTDWTTQLFLDSFSIGEHGSQGPRLTGSPGAPSVFVWPSRRNLGPMPPGEMFRAGGVVWQFALGGEGFEAPGLTAGASTALAGLSRFVGDGGGITVRFSVYLTGPEISSESLSARLVAGEDVSNPAFGRVTGVIEPWNPGTERTQPEGRLLEPAGPATWKGEPFTLGPATVVVDAIAGRLSIDLLNAIPEVDIERTKVDLGPLLVQLRQADGTLVPVSTLAPGDYGREAYVSRAGIVDLPYPAPLRERIDALPLVVTTADGTVLLAEKEAVVFVRDRGVYGEPGDPIEIGLRVLIRGRPPEAPVTIQVAQYREPWGDHPIDSGISIDPPKPPFDHLVAPVTTGLAPVVRVPRSVRTDALGRATVSGLAIEAGFGALRFEVGNDEIVETPWGASPASSRSFLRILPSFDYGRIPDESVTWPLVYSEVLRYYAVVHPGMSRFVDLADEHAVRQNAERILAATDPAGWNGVRFMPVTRDLSRGKRELLRRWLRKVIDERPREMDDRVERLPFTLSITEVDSPALPVLQSAVVGVASDGRWLLLGGLGAGLHGLDGDPEEAFARRRFNTSVHVFDPASGRVASRPLADLVAPDLVAGLLTTGAQFVQVDGQLFVVGGYGFTPDGESMTTHARLTVIDVDPLVRAVEEGTSATGLVRQSTADERLAVTGGQLVHSDGTFHLVFGWRFEGLYTRASGGDYTHQVRSFRTVDRPGERPRIEAYQASGSVADDPAFRRRDLNVVPALGPDGAAGFTVYGGVFTPDGGPWHRPVAIAPEGGAVRLTLDQSGFRQAMCQYECPTLALYDGRTRALHTVFFGGISEVRHDPLLGFVRDEDPAFVDDITCITREADGRSGEELVCHPGHRPVPLALPARMGASASIVLAAGVRTRHGVVLLDEVDGPTVVGHIYGGIVSPRPHGGADTRATNRLLRVTLSAVESPALPIEVPD